MPGWRGEMLCSLGCLLRTMSDPGGVTQGGAGDGKGVNLGRRVICMQLRVSQSSTLPQATSAMTQLRSTGGPPRQFSRAETVPEPLRPPLPPSGSGISISKAAHTRHWVGGRSLPPAKSRLLPLLHISYQLHSITPTTPCSQPPSCLF